MPTHIFCACRIAPWQAAIKITVFSAAGFPRARKQEKTFHQDDRTEDKPNRLFLPRPWKQPARGNQDETVGRGTPLPTSLSTKVRQNVREVSQGPSPPAAADDSSVPTFPGRQAKKLIAPTRKT